MAPDIELTRRDLLGDMLGCLGALTVGATMPDLRAIADLVSMDSPETSQREILARKERILHFLSDLPNRHPDRVLIGQDFGFPRPKDFDNMVGRLGRVTGKLPGMIAGDYLMPNGALPTEGEYHSFNALLLDHARKGGVICLASHFKNPWGDLADDKNAAWNRDFPIGNFEEIFNIHTKAGENFRKSLDAVAGGLADLQKQGVVVLYRPFHEQNGNWFWWGSNLEAEKGSQDLTEHGVTPDQYKKLWSFTHEYLTRSKGLDNLLWCFAPNYQWDEPVARSTTDYYPGSGVVDVIGLDYYKDDPNALDSRGSVSNIDKLGKPYGLAEFGSLRQRDGTYDNSSVLEVIRDKFKRLSWICVYASFKDQDGKDHKVAIVDTKGGKEMMTSDLVITLDRMPKALKF